MGIAGRQKVQLGDDLRRGQPEDKAHRICQAIVGADGAGAEGIHLHHHRLGFSDGVGQRHLAPAAQPGGHEVFGDVAGHICPRTVHLGGILPGKGAATMGCEHTVAVHHEFPSGEAGVGLRSAKHKPPGGVQQDFGILVRGKRLQRRGQHLVGEFPKQFIGGLLRAVLGGEDNRVQPQGASILVVLHGDLGFSIRAQAPHHAGFPGGGEAAGQPVGQYNGKRHHLRGFRTGVSNHDPLVTGAQAEDRILEGSPSLL